MPSSHSSSGAPESSQRLDILAFGAHPDDVELSCAGTLLAEVAHGRKVGVVDLTEGELGTRGTPELRLREADAAGQIMGLTARVNLGLPDGFLEEDRDSLLAVVRVLRHYQPRIVLANALEDRHPDHKRGGDLVERACFLAGLARIESERDGIAQSVHRPQRVLRYIQDRWIIPSLVLDISTYMDRKLEAVQAYGSQFYDPKSSEPATYIATPEFLEGLRSRAREMGRLIGCHYGEGFTMRQPPGLSSLSGLL
jgi:bacillithiol biosynthesis deacetylase BshB1